MIIHNSSAAKIMETSSLWSAMLSFLLFSMVKMVYGAQVPAMFVFGDSLLDPGNNNHLKTLAKANFPPNGIDFATGTTGRFCNGATIADHLGFMLGFGLIPAINDPNTQGENILQGVNFASSAAGILNNTGNLFGQRLNMFEQLETFQNNILPMLSSQVLQSNGEELTIEDFLAKSLFISNIGNNDFLNTYMLPLANPLHKPIPPTFTDLLINEYRIHLKNLYNYGARKVLVTGLAPLGCLPTIIGFFSKDINQCYEPYNDVTVQFNIKLKSMIQQLNKEVSGAYFLYWDVYTPVRHMIDNPSLYGFKYSHIACCGGGRANGMNLCTPAAFLCLDRSEFIFWDPFHTSDAVNQIAAKQVYEGKVQGNYPMNVKQLLHL